MAKILVSEVMTRDPISISPEASLLECAKILVKKKVGTILLVDQKKLIGIISESDILWAITKKPDADLRKIKAKDISPKKIAIIKPTATIIETINKMKKQKFTKFPVIQKRELVGLITMKDILNFHPEFYPEFDEMYKIREEAKKLRRIKQASDIRDGNCDLCGARDILYKFNGNTICPTCREKV